MSKTKKPAIGRGLSALLDNDEHDDIIASSIAEIALSDIDVNPNQPRKTFDEESLEELAVSIQSMGLVQPITLQKKSDGRYMLIAGERRYRAASKVGLSSLPAYIRDIDGHQIMELALIENIQRQDLNAIEVALSFQSIIDANHITHEALAQKVGKNRTTITNYVRLLKLPAEIQLGITKNLITMGHARALLAITDPLRQLEVFNKIIKEDLSVRAVEQIASLSTNEDNKKTDKQVVRNSFDELTKILSRTFSTKVAISQNKNGKGKLTIPFATEEELERILILLEKIKQ